MANLHLEKMRDTWETFKSIQTHSEADIDQLMTLVSQNPTMINPMMTSNGREEVRNFLLADINWSHPVIYWEVYEANRLAFQWSQFPLANTKRHPKLLYSCATWTFDDNGLLHQYYGAWCKVECYEALIDAGIQVEPDRFVGLVIAEKLRRKNA